MRLRLLGGRLTFVAEVFGKLHLSLPVQILPIVRDLRPDLLDRRFRDLDLGRLKLFKAGDAGLCHTTLSARSAASR
ncbi:MAG: hypothetical protein JWR89_5097 [Tardiphaga sp.]|nr:hypothetical protein [Tardiphaga sp.]